jgi:GH24 family phage-related lysozyme (muramidase)
MSSIKNYFSEKFGQTNRPPFDVVKLRLQLITDEGVVYVIYMDHLGNETFGIGHLINADDAEYGKPVGTIITSKRVSEAFDYDVEWTLADCRRVFSGWDYYPAEAQQVFANMMFNMGATRLAKFKKMIAAANAGDWSEAASEGRNSIWYSQVINRAERLMVRLEAI